MVYRGELVLLGKGNSGMVPLPPSFLPSFSLVDLG